MNIKDYEKLQKVWLDTNNLKVGDRVKIVHTVKEGELGWYNNWTRRMTELVGTHAKIIEITENGITLQTEMDDVKRWDNVYWTYPFFALERYSKTIAFVVASDRIIDDGIQVEYDGNRVLISDYHDRFALTLDQMKEIVEKIENEF